MSDKNLKPLEIVAVEEPWAVATLKDGTKVRAKLVFDSVAQELDERGNPVAEDGGRPRLHVSFKWVIGDSTPPRPKGN